MLRKLRPTYTLLLLLLFLRWQAALGATAGDTIVGRGLQFLVDTEGHASLIALTDDRSSALVPAVITDSLGAEYSVTGVADNAFVTSPGLTALALPAGVTNISDNAFAQCDNLQLVVSHIGDPRLLLGLPAEAQVSVSPELYERYAAVFPAERLHRLVNVDDNPLSYNPADVNRDGTVNAADITALYNHVLTGATVAAGDVNGDGDVNAADITHAYNVILSGDATGTGSEGVAFVTVNSATGAVTSRLMQSVSLPVGTSLAIAVHDNAAKQLLPHSPAIIANDMPRYNHSGGDVDALVIDNSHYTTGGTVPVILYTNDSDGNTMYQEVTVTVMPHVVTDTLRVLSVGNSFSLDALSYVPFIMKAVAPQVYLKLGVMYIGYGSLENFDVTLHSSSGAWRYHYCEGGERWQWHDGETMNAVLARQPWDVILLQQNSNLSRDYSSYQPYLNNVISWFDDNVSNPHETGWLITPSYPDNLSRLAPDTTSTQMMQRILESVRAVQRDTGIELLLPCGTAIQNARTTPLDSLGDRGELFDDLHLQDGLPCLIEAYVATAALLERYGLSDRVWTDTTWIDTQWLAKHAIPEVNGDPVGMSEENREIGIKCAREALEKPLEITKIDY